MQTNPEHQESKQEKAITLAVTAITLLALMVLANLTPDMLNKLLH